jgi:DNA replication and repair protein RecF
VYKKGANFVLDGLRVQNFRSYQDYSIDLEQGVNIVVGPNAAGKTNLLEAILLVAQFSTYRNGNNALIYHGCEWARIDGIGKNTQRTIKLITQQNDIIKKAIEIDSKEYKRASHQQRYPAVLFEPNHLQLLHGGPEKRRDFIDNIIEQINPTYRTTRLHYRRALQQRNALLKQKQLLNSGDTDAMFVWNLRLSDLGGSIIKERTQLINSMNKTIQHIYQEISGDRKSIKLEYRSQFDTDNYTQKLLLAHEKSLLVDCERGYTTHGPHRDDMLVYIGNKLAEENASRGEIRTILLALKVIELQIIEEKTNRPPLLLLDDVFSELDGLRRKRLTEFFQNNQTFITTTDADVVAKSWSQKVNLITL